MYKKMIRKHKTNYIPHIVMTITMIILSSASIYDVCYNNVDKMVALRDIIIINPLMSVCLAMLISIFIERSNEVKEK